MEDNKRPVGDFLPLIKVGGKYRMNVNYEHTVTIFSTTINNPYASKNTVLGVWSAESNGVRYDHVTSWDKYGRWYDSVDNLYPSMCLVEITNDESEP